MDIRRQLALNIVDLRKERGWSQENLAEECELHRTYVSGVERGVRNPTVLVIEKIAGALKVPVSRLLEQRPETPPKGSSRRPPARRGRT